MGNARKKYLKVFLNLGIALVILLLVVVLLPRVLVFFSPFLVGYIIALIASPLVKFFEEKMKIRRKAGTVFVIIAVLALVVLAVYVVGAKLVEQVVGLTTALPDMWNSMEADFKQIGANMEIFLNRLPMDTKDTINGIVAQMDTLMAEVLSSISTPTISAVGSFA